MRLLLCAVGRMRGSPERALVDDYTLRFDRLGRQLGLGPLTEVEIDERKSPDPPAQAADILRRLPASAWTVALDERGAALDSPGLAQVLGQRRDAGVQDLALLIGGADGLDPGLRSRAGLVLSLGAMVWPHMLARVMLAEQLYRAATILAGTPYHRA